MKKDSGGDIDKWFQYNYFPEKRTIFLGSHSAGRDYEEGESGTDCQMSEFFIKAMVHLSTTDQPIIVHMNNLGGDWYHGMAIYDMIKAVDAHVYGVCWGHAMSMGSIIVQACDSRITSQNCTFMIHDGEETISGTAKTVESWTKYNSKLKKKMYKIYYERMSLSNPRITLKKIESMCDHDTVFTAQEAVEMGLADWVMDRISDPHRFYATDEYGTKWHPGMKFGKYDTKDGEISE